MLVKVVQERVKGVVTPGHGLSNRAVRSPVCLKL